MAFLGDEILFVLCANITVTFSCMSGAYLDYTTLRMSKMQRAELDKQNQIRNPKT